MLVNLCTVVLIMIHGVEGLSLNQAQKVLVKTKGKTVSFRCEVTGLGNGNFVHWYHKKDGGTFKRLLYISESGVATDEAKEFVSEKTGNSYGIKLKEIKEEHAGMYHCACWEGDKKVFGSGTRLYVTASGDDKTEAPVLSAYLPSVQKSDEQTMVCQASGMFPDLVKFTWKKKTKTSDWAEVSANNVAEQRNETPNKKPNGKPNVIVTSMMTDKTTAEENPEYNCTVEHEGSKETITKALKKKGEERSTKEIIQATGSPTVTKKTLQRQNSVASEQMPGLNLFVHAYGIMLMKNGAYFCSISIFLLKRKFEKKE